MRKQIAYPSCGQGQIRGLRWEPEGEITAVVQIVHGIAEHVQRYDHFASWLAQQGVLVVAQDHMGHGSSIEGGSPKGYFTGGWFAAVEDTYRLLRDTMGEFPHVPYILLGHSMGSFIARTILCKYPDSGIAGAIISGTAWMPGGVITAGHALAGIICKLQDEKQPSDILQGMMFGSYNKRIETVRTKSDWLTRDEAIVDAYEADPDCGFATSAALLRDMLVGLKFVHNKKHLQQMTPNLPVLFLSGEEDPVGGYGAGVRAAAEAFQKTGMQQVSLKLYPQGRHEMLNELNRDEVYGDILHWIERL